MMKYIHCTVKRDSLDIAAVNAALQLLPWQHYFWHAGSCSKTILISIKTTGWPC